MLFKSTNLQPGKTFAILMTAMLLSVVLLSACAGPIPAPTAAPTQLLQPIALTAAPLPAADDLPAPAEPLPLSPAQVRDIAVRFLVARAQLESPDEWLDQDLTPPDQVGSSTFRYTSGAWTVLVQFPVVAPQLMVYTVRVDHIAGGMRWEGRVGADGALIETAYTPPAMVQSPAAARQFAVNFILTRYQWSQPSDWTEQEPRPLENAVTRYTYTSGPWVVQVDAPAAAPLVPAYQVTADLMNEGLRWTGSVSASGEVVEE